MSRVWVARSKRDLKELQLIGGGEYPKDQRKPNYVPPEQSKELEVAAWRRDGKGKEKLWSHGKVFEGHQYVKERLHSFRLEKAEHCKEK